MNQLRPRAMTQAEFAAMLQREGFSACTKTAVSLAERPAESGVQFTPQARKVAQGLAVPARHAENRANPNKTTVWLDDETRIWLENRAYMEDTNVGELIRRYIRICIMADKVSRDYLKNHPVAPPKPLEYRSEDGFRKAMQNPFRDCTLIIPKGGEPNGKIDL